MSQASVNHKPSAEASEAEPQVSPHLLPPNLPEPTPELPVFECEPFGIDFFEHATNKFVYERELDCTPEKLWEIFEDPVSWTVWGGPGIAKVDWTTEKPFKLGTERTVTFIGGMEVYERFIRWEENKGMAFYFRGATQKVWWRFGEHHEVFPVHGGKCLWRWTVVYEPRDVFAKIHSLAGPMKKFFLGKGIADKLVRYVQKLLARLESLPPPRAGYRISKKKFDTNLARFLGITEAIYHVGGCFGRNAGAVGDGLE